MSELSKSIAEAEALVVAMRADPVAGPGRVSRLPQLQACALKYEGKVSAVDPVSGVPLYGTAMQAKVARLSALVNELEALVSMLGPACAAGAATAPYSPPPALVSNDLDTIILRQNEERERAMKDAAVTASVQSERFVGTRLFRDALSRQLAALNRAYDDRTLQDTSIKRSETVAEVAKYIENPARCIATVVSILDAIVRNPDNELLRTLRWRHPQLLEKLSTHGYPAMRLLAALGFEVAAEKLSAELLTWIESQYESWQGRGTGERVDVDWGNFFRSAQDGASENCFEPIFFSLVRGDSHLHQDFVLFMKEPNLELDMDRWMQWFDDLKESHGVLASCA